MARTRQDYNRSRNRITSKYSPRTGFLTAIWITVMLSSSAVAGSHEVVSTPQQLDSHVTASQLNPNVTLKIALQIMMQLLDDINNSQVGEISRSVNPTLLASDAADLIYGYATYGLKPGLTAQDISTGIQQGESAIFILQSDPDLIQLSPTTQGALTSSLESMVNELKSIL